MTVPAVPIRSAPMSASPSPSLAVVTASKWRTRTGVVHTTIVGKITLALEPGAEASLAPADSLVLFDQIAPDARFVLAASELAPWTTVGSVVASGGPLRFTLLAPDGTRRLVLTPPAGAPAGYSMSSAERASYAGERPSRGQDGVLVIPEKIDGRYFLAAPRHYQLEAISGDEAFVLELPGARLAARLPGLSLMATVQVGPRQRVITLTADMIVVDGARRRVSLVARALVRGEAKLVKHAIVSAGQQAYIDRGDTFTTTSFEPQDDETTELSMEELEARGVFSSPFDSDEETHLLSDPHAAPPASPSVKTLPATPFDPGFAPAQVVPGVGVLATLAPNQTLEEQLAAMRAQLRAEDPEDGAEESGSSLVDSAKEAHPPKVVAPVAGAMAKPRFKKK